MKKRQSNVMQNIFSIFKLSSVIICLFTTFKISAAELPAKSIEMIRGILSTNAGEKAMSRLAKVSPELFQSMSVDQKLDLIQQKMKQDSQLQEVISTGLQKININGDSNISFEKAAEVFEFIQISNSRPSVETHKISEVSQKGMMTEEQRNSFLSRVNRKDVNIEQGRLALQVAEQESQILGASILGEGLSSCYQNFKTEAIDTVHKLIIATKGAQTTQELKQKLIGSYSAIMKVDGAESARRVCLLAGVGSPGTPVCKIFGAPVASTCPQ